MASHPQPRAARVAAALGVAAGLLTAGAAAGAEYDVVIRGGRVVDGSGAPWRRADVGVRDGRIAKVGEGLARGAREIDAAGRYVSPGWIDMMDQSGAILLRHGGAPNKLRMGVTTAIAGEIAPPAPPEGLSAYLDALEARGLAINFGTAYSLGEIRRRVVGDTAAAPTAAQFEAMKGQVACAMEEGALGVTSALVYPPGVFQSRDELAALARAAAPYGGYYAAHVRDEGPGLVAAIEEAIAIGEAAGLPVEIFHLKAAYRPAAGRLMPQAIAAIAAARGRGVDVTANLYPYVAAATGLEVTVPTWVFADGWPAALARLRDPAVRAQLKREVAAGPAPGWSNFVAASGGWANIRLANAQSPAYDRYRFRSLAEIAGELGQDPADVAWDILLAAQPKRPLAIYFMMDEADVEAALAQAWTSIGSDAAAAARLGEVDGLGLAHPRSYGAFPRVLAEYVRRRGVLSLEAAVRKMSALPAARAGLRDRGLIREGLRADLVVFDLARIEDRATWDAPTLPATGVDDVLVNGELVLAAGRETGARPGMALRGPGAAPGRPSPACRRPAPLTFLPPPPRSGTAPQPAGDRP